MAERPQSASEPCKGCGASLKWLRTKAGEWMPVEFASWDGETIYDPAKHINHWGNCPKAKEFKKKK